MSRPSKSKKTNKLHPRNEHQGRYDFTQLKSVCPELIPFAHTNRYGTESIDFFDSQAVKVLNRALLKQHYKIKHWDIPKGYLCPPIPGRADYIHYIADILGQTNNQKIPKGNKVKVLDIGVGANCVYPIIGHQVYGWSFVGAEIDAKAIQNACSIIQQNPSLNNIEIRQQTKKQVIFKGIIQEQERFHITICNPPFHSSMTEARKGTLRKLSNLKSKKVKKVHLNFGGQYHELCCDGGEAQFIQTMIEQSKDFAYNCCWFSTLISKQTNVSIAKAALKKANAAQIKVISMTQGNKNSRIFVWSFLTITQQQHWIKNISK